MFHPSSFTLLTTTILLLAGGAQVQAHIAPFAKGLWECKDRSFGVPANPLFNKTKFGPDGWWFHGDDCFKNRPPLDEYLELPAGGKFMTEMSGNKYFTSLVKDGNITEFGDGQTTPQRVGPDPLCISVPNLHAKNESDVAGYAFAISYQNDPSKVTLENLVIFTTNRDTPYRRIAWFDVPADLPECPPGGCICAALWIPNGCGQANEYMMGYNCKVTNVKPTARALAPAKTPVWCEGEPDKCIKGAKGMIVFNQLEGNNINIDGQQLGGDAKSPGYNMKTGFADGAQNDIFLDVAPQIALASKPATSNGGSAATSSATSTTTGAATSSVKSAATSSAKSTATSSANSTANTARCRGHHTGKSRMV